MKFILCNHDFCAMLSFGKDLQKVSLWELIELIPQEAMQSSQSS